MNTVPIVFAIDNNVVMQCGVTITSLLMNAKADTYYDIYILCNQSKLDGEERKKLNDAFAENSQCRISFVDVQGNDAFKENDWQTTGHLTLAAFYRLAIPLLFPQFDKVIYADVDMIFQQDLSELFADSLQQQKLLAAVLDLAIDDKYYFQSKLPSMVGKSVKDYFNSGFMVMNLKQMRDENIVEEFNRHTKVKYDQNDQDVLNVVCNGRVQFLPCMYNFQLNHFASYMWGRTSADIRFGELFRYATLHYTGKLKPWNSLECVASDTWWHYYKMSPFYDDMVYFRRQYDQIESHKNDFRVKSNKQLLTRVMVNIKHKLFG
jgi:lipopolysaccharide biosynthesis glycosyltransferase